MADIESPNNIGLLQRDASKKIKPETEIWTRLEFEKKVSPHFVGAINCQKGYQRKLSESGTHDLSLFESLKEAKEKFYEALDQFQSSDYKPTERINSTALNQFDEYRNLDWRKDEVISELDSLIKELIDWPPTYSKSKSGS